MFFATIVEAIAYEVPVGSLTETFTATLFVPTVGILTCSDLPTFVDTAVVAFFAVTFVRFLVDVVVAKYVLFAVVGDGVGVAVAEGADVAVGVGVGVGVGVATGVGVAVGVGVGVATGVGVGVGAGVTGSVFAPGSEIANRVVPAKKDPSSIVKVSFATSPMYSL